MIGRVITGFSYTLPAQAAAFPSAAACGHGEPVNEGSSPAKLSPPSHKQHGRPRQHTVPAHSDFTNPFGWPPRHAPRLALPSAESRGHADAVWPSRAAADAEALDRSLDLVEVFVGQRHGRPSEPAVDLIGGTGADYRSGHPPPGKHPGQRDRSYICPMTRRDRLEAIAKREIATQPRLIELFG
jgi:hypothetical protein